MLSGQDPGCDKEGKGVPQDDKEALRWLKSAEEGSSDFLPGHFDYWDVPPLVPSPVAPRRVGAVRPRDTEWTPETRDELAREPPAGSSQDLSLPSLDFSTAPD